MVMFTRVLLAAGLGMAAIQFVGPSRTNPPSDPERSLTRHVPIPADVDAILSRACRNCHSNDTSWPWYAYVAPVSWNVIGHVNHGREHFNMSDWPESPEEGMDILDEVCRQVTERKMPLPSYTWVHRDAVLSDADRRRLCAWTDEAIDTLIGTDAGGEED